MKSKCIFGVSAIIAQLVYSRKLMSKMVLFIAMVMCSYVVAASPKFPVYVKLGPNYLWAQSNNFYFERINPIEGTLTPSISSQSISDGNWAGNVALGLTYSVSPVWQLGPELSYLQLGKYTTRIDPFITGPYEFMDIVNSFSSKMDGNIVSAFLNVGYMLQNNYIIYVAPGVGLATIKTRNVLNYQADMDTTHLLLKSSENRTNVIPQLSVGIKYAMTPRLQLDLGFNYSWLGKISTSTFSRDGYTATHVAAKNVSLLGPRFNILFYF